MFKHAMLAGFNVSGSAIPSFADIDGDGDFDAFVGESGCAVDVHSMALASAVLPTSRSAEVGTTMTAFATMSLW